MAVANNQHIRPNIGLTDEQREGVAETLTRVLADEMTLYVRLRKYHWNVTGPQFHSLHELFEQQYTQLEAIIDVTAERIRTYGAMSPGTLAEFQQLSRLEGKLRLQRVRLRDAFRSLHDHRIHYDPVPALHVEPHTHRTAVVPHLVDLRHQPHPGLEVALPLEQLQLPQVPGHVAATETGLDLGQQAVDGGRAGLEAVARVEHRVAGEVGGGPGLGVRDAVGLRRYLADDEDEVGPVEVPYVWHPGLHHYGINLEVPGDGTYTIRVHVEPPTFHRHDETNGDRYAESVEVEFEDVPLDFDAEALLFPGDQVTVFGEADDDFFEGRVIDAETVYLRNQSTIYTAEPAVTTVYYVDPYGASAVDGTMVSMDGTVSRVRGREFTLDVGGIDISVDTIDLGYNPLDDQGRQQIDTGDSVTVVGMVDDDLFDETEVSATAVYSRETGDDRQSGARSSQQDGSENARSRSARGQNAASASGEERSDQASRSARSQQSEEKDEFDLLDRNNNGVVTQKEYVRYTAKAENITRPDARKLFDAVAGEDDRLTREEFLSPDPEAEDVFERILPTDG